MKKLEILGYIWIFTSISLCIGLYKLELSKRVIDEEYEYIKKHRAFGNLTKYLTIIAIVSVVVNDTLRMYKNDDIRMYNFNCITDTIVEVITTCNTYTLLTVHLL